MDHVASKPIVFIVAQDGFQEHEYMAPKRILEAAGYVVRTASHVVGPARSHMGTVIETDLRVTDILPEDYAGVFVVGGPGAPVFLEQEEVYRVVRDAAHSCPLWGAICYSPRVLAHADVLRGKRATGWNGDNELGEVLGEAGGILVAEPVVTDGSLITADGPLSAEEFGCAILVRLSAASGEKGV